MRNTQNLDRKPPQRDKVMKNLIHFDVKARIHPIVRLGVLIVLALPKVEAATMGSRLQQMNAVERAKFETFVQNDVKTDLGKNFLDRVVAPIRKLSKPNAMSPETQAVLVSGIYSSILSSITTANAQLAKTKAKYRVPVPSKETIEKKIAEVLRWSASYGLFPTAFTAGVMGRAQLGAGANVGYQANFYFDQGDFKMSTYWMGGLQSGPEAQAKVQFYIAFCFGECFGGGSDGLYVGIDGMTGAGMGAGFFIEGGLDVTDLALSSFSREKYEIKELFSTKVIYAGFGLDVGVGAGISSNLLYYNLQNEKVLVPKNNVVTESEIAKFRLL